MKGQPTLHPMEIAISGAGISEISFGILGFLHVNPVQFFHNADSILIDLRFCFRSCGIALKHIGSQVLSQGLGNLTAAGIMDADKCHLFLTHI